MADNFGLKIGLEGEKEFKKALSEINQSFKVLGSEMKLATSQFDKNDKSVDALTARNKVLRNDAYRKVIWQCNHKFDGQKCATPTLTEDEIKELFLRVANQVIDQKEQFIAIYEQVLSRSLDTADLESELSDLEAEINIASELIEECIKENAHVALDQAEYQKRYDGLVARFDKAKTRHIEVTDLIAERTGRRHQIETYLKELWSREPLTEFRETDWLAMVDYITVHSKKDIRVTFKDGTEIKA